MKSDENKGFDHIWLVFQAQGLISVEKECVLPFLVFFWIFFTF